MFGKEIPRIFKIFEGPKSEDLARGVGTVMAFKLAASEQFSLVAYVELSNVEFSDKGRESVQINAYVLKRWSWKDGRPDFKSASRGNRCFILYWPEVGSGDIFIYP